MCFSPYSLRSLLCSTQDFPFRTMRDVRERARVEAKGWVGFGTFNLARGDRSVSLQRKGTVTELFSSPQLAELLVIIESS